MCILRHGKRKTPYAKRIFKKRGSKVEPVLGTMLNFLNLKRVNSRGIKQANKHCLMSALTYNLKKYLKFIKNKRISVCMQLEKSVILTKGSTFSTFYVHRLFHSLV